MGRIVNLLKTEMEKFIIATFESYSAFSQKAFVFAPSGDDSPPLEDDRLVVVSVDGQGQFAVVGTLVTTQGAKAGEKILYSRDAKGKLAAAIKLLNDGVIEIDGESVKINGGGEKAARKGDKVKVTIPANSFIVSVTGQATGMPNINSVEIEGTIETGSEGVEIG